MTDITEQQIKQLADGLPPSVIGLDHEEIITWLAKSLSQRDAQLAELAKQEPDYYVCDDGSGLEVNKHNEFSCGRNGFPVYRAAPPAPVDDLVMLIRRLVHALKKSNPDSQLISQVSDYMQRSGHWQATDFLRSVEDE